MHSSHETQSEQHALRLIDQRTFNLSHEQIKAAIDNIRTSKNDAQERLVEADSLVLDSSIFVIEAALNYEFDSIEDSSYVTEMDTTNYTTAITSVNNKVNSDDVETAYQELRNQVTDILDASESSVVKLVDVEGYLSEDGQVVYQAYVVTFKKSKPYTCNLTPFNNILCTYVGIINNSIFQLNFGCNPNLCSGDAVIAKAVNCVDYIYYTDCGKTWYWSNITSTSFDPGAVNTSNPYPTALKKTQEFTANDWCTNPVAVTFVRQMHYSSANGYIVPIINLANSNIPTGKAWANSWLGSGVYAGSTTNLKYIKWVLTASYGVRTCYTPNQ